MVEEAKTKTSIGYKKFLFHRGTSVLIRYFLSTELIYYAISDMCHKRKGMRSPIQANIALLMYSMYVLLGISSPKESHPTRHKPCGLERDTRLALVGSMWKT